MPLSNEERAALQARAAGLREEVSAVRAERDNAVLVNSNDNADQKLLDEVKRLEADLDAAKESRDKALGADGSASDAIKVMNQVAGATDQPKAEEPEAVVVPEIVEVPEEQPADTGSGQTEEVAVPEAPKFSDDPFGGSSI